MKKILSILAIALAFAFVSCTQEDIKKPCEINHTCTVIVKNQHINADNYLYVDVTTDPNGVGGYNQGYLVEDGGSVEFDNLASGTIYVWAISQAHYDNHDAWQRSTIYVGDCQTKTFTWTKK